MPFLLEESKYAAISHLGSGTFERSNGEALGAPRRVIIPVPRNRLPARRADHRRSPLCSMSASNILRIPCSTGFGSVIPKRCNKR